MVSLEALSASDNILLMMLGVTVFIVTVRVVAREHRIKRRASARPPATVSRRRSTADGFQVRAIASGSAGSREEPGTEDRPADADVGRRMLG